MSKVSANLPSAAAGGQPPSRHPMATGAAPQQSLPPGMLPGPQSPPTGTPATGAVLGMTAEAPTAGGSATQVCVTHFPSLNQIYSVYTVSCCE